MSPKVSFIVPCYNLAHLLPECVASILAQTFTDFEVLVMDDCSPDNTPEVAGAFADPRVIHVRNEQNLRHLANYNKGIDLSRGEYVWLISADDKLRTPHVLQQYVALMDDRPEVGFVFCSAIGLKSAMETGIVKWAYHGPHDAVFKGHEFMQLLLHNNCVAAPSGMVRRSCYERELFPLDMPYAGDWYLWCLFSLYDDVAYFAEPMVNYREHDFSMTNNLKNQDNHILVNDDLKVLWRMYEKLHGQGIPHLVKVCVKELSRRYAAAIADEGGEKQEYALSLRCLVNGFSDKSGKQGDSGRLCAQILTCLGDRQHSNGNGALATRYYGAAMRFHPVTPDIYIKYLFERIGRPGRYLRNVGTYVNRFLKGRMRSPGYSA